MAARPYNDHGRNLRRRHLPGIDRDDGLFHATVGPVARVVACLVGLLLWIPVNAFASAGIVVAGAAASGILLLAFEIVMMQAKSTADLGRSGTMLKVDAYNHIMPIGFFNRLQEVSPNPSNMQNRVRQVPMMTDLDERFRVMDSFDEYCQILSLSSPPIEISADPKYAVELMQMANDEMAELCSKYRTASRDSSRRCRLSALTQ